MGGTVRLNIEYCRFNIDEFVKSLHTRHSRARGNPELAENTGFRIKSGMTNKVDFDFLRNHQYLALIDLGKIHSAQGQNR